MAGGRRRDPFSSSFFSLFFRFYFFSLLDGDGLGQVAGEVDVETLQDGQPVGNQLQGNDVKNTLETIDGLGDLDLGRLAGLELLVALVADDDGPSTTGNDCENKLEN